MLDIGRARYAPTTAIADHVLTRSGRQCVRPGCPRPAAHLNHAQPWAEDGTTAAANLTGLCVGDHRARHTGWTVNIGQDGGTSMTTTHGFTATTPPHDHRPHDHRGHDTGTPSRPTATAGETRPTGETGPIGTDSPGRAKPAEPTSPPPQPTRPAAARPRDRAPDWRPPTPLARLQALFPSVDHTDFPTPEPNGVGDPQTGEGWLTDMQHYIAVTHDRARENRVDPSAPPPRQALDPPTPEREEPDDQPPF